MAQHDALSAEEEEELAPLIDALLRENPWESPGKYFGVELAQTIAGPKLLALNKRQQAAALGRFLDHRARYVELARTRSHQAQHSDPHSQDVASSRALADVAIWGLLKRTLPLSDETLRTALGLILSVSHLNAFLLPLAGIAAAVENRAADGPFGAELEQDLRSAIKRLREEALDAGSRKAADRMTKLVVEEPTAWIDSGEAWSDAAIADLDATDPVRRQNWSHVLASCQTAGPGKPSAKWLKEARQLLESLGHAEFKERILRWFPLVDRPRTGPRPRPQQWQQAPHDDMIEPHHVALLRGLCWYSSLSADRDLGRALAALAQSAYRKTPGKGPRLISLGHAAVAALGAMPGMDSVGQLVLLKVKLKFIPCAEGGAKGALLRGRARGPPPRRGRRDRRTLLRHAGSRPPPRNSGRLEGGTSRRRAGCRAAWSCAGGKPLKSVPAAAKKEHAEDVKELQTAVKDVGKMLTAQRERIDSLFLSRRRWPLDVWRGRYLDHPLVGVIARRLIWHFETDGAAALGIWLDGRLVDVHDHELSRLNERTTVELWHPIGHAIDEVTAWRDWLDRHQVRQPFKQAHREVYVLTDAERATRVYSNRFAAHILRQHQYHALAAARRWRNKLRLMVDAAYPPTSKELPEWGLLRRVLGRGLRRRLRYGYHRDRHVPLPGHRPGPLLPNRGRPAPRACQRRRVYVGAEPRRPRARPPRRDSTPRALRDSSRCRPVCRRCQRRQRSGLVRRRP